LAGAEQYLAILVSLGMLVVQIQTLVNEPKTQHVRATRTTHEKGAAREIITSEQNKKEAT